MSFERAREPKDDDTASLARAVREGDTGRFDTLYERLLPALYAWAAVRVPREKMTPEDFLQEVWFRALRNLDTDAAQRHPFRAWVFVIAKNTLLEVLRWRTPSPSANSPTEPSTLARVVPDSTVSAASRLAQDETLHLLLEFTRKLDPLDRDLVVHCALEGKPCTAVAQQLGLTPDAAAKRWQRLRERLREMGWLRRLLLEVA